MFGGMFPFVITVVILAFVGQVGYSYLRTKKRAEAAVAATAATGLAVAPAGEDAPNLPFQLFQRGHSRKVRNRMWDPKDPSASVFDYQFTVTSGSGDHRSSHTYRQTCAIYPLPFTAPMFSLSHQGFFDKIAVSFGGNDVVVGHAEFDETYRVKCADATFARTLLDQRFVNFMLLEGQEGLLRVELYGTYLLITSGKEIPVEHFDDLLALGHRLIASLPPALSGQQLQQPPQGLVGQPWNPYQGPMPAAGAGPAMAPGPMPAGPMPAGPMPAGPMAAPGAVIRPADAPNPLTAPPVARPPMGPPPSERPRSTPIE